MCICGGASLNVVYKVRKYGCTKYISLLKFIVQFAASDLTLYLNKKDWDFWKREKKKKIQKCNCQYFFVIRTILDWATYGCHIVGLTQGTMHTRTTSHLKCAACALLKPFFCLFLLLLLQWSKKVGSKWSWQSLTLQALGTKSTMTTGRFSANLPTYYLLIEKRFLFPQRAAVSCFLCPTAGNQFLSTSMSSLRSSWRKRWTSPGRSESLTPECTAASTSSPRLDTRK